MKGFQYQPVIIAALLSTTAIALAGGMVQAVTMDRTTLQKPTVPIRIAQQSNFSSFFESGRLRAEDQLTFRRSPDPAIPVNPTSQFWQPIISEAGGYSLWMPPGILTQETVVLKTSIGSLSFQTLAANSDKTRYVAAYADQLTDAQIQDAPALLQAIRDRVAPAQQYQLKQEKPITLNNQYPGRELRFQGKSDEIVLRTYLVNRRAYVLGVKQPISSAATRQATAFLNSLRVF